MPQDYIAYRLSSCANRKAIIDTIEQIWRDLHTPSSATFLLAEKYGVDFDQIPNGSIYEHIKIEDDGAGLDPYVVQFVVSFSASVAGHAAKGCWNMFILPLLQKKFGATSIQETEKSPDK